MAIKRTQPICWWCKHFDADAQRRRLVWRCAAFDGNIPAAIINGEYDHREPHPEDNGTQFEAEHTALLTDRVVFQHHTPDAITTALQDALLLLEMGRALGGVQPPLDDE